MATTERTVETSTSLTDLGLLILRIGIGAAMVQAGLIKLLDFSTTVGFMESGGWSMRHSQPSSCPSRRRPAGSGSSWAS
jgi:putative oxidoreductase